MNVILLGAPGAGKGTQALQLASRCHLKHLSTGDLLRNAVKQGSSLGAKAKEFMDRGELVADEVVVGLIRETLPEKGGVILDGFPRTLEQAHALDKMMSEAGQSLDLVLNLEVADEEIVKRLSGRRSCPSCGSIFNIYSSPSSKGEDCGKCGQKLIQRSDDQEDTIRTRLDVYRVQTSPLVDYYQEQGKVETISASDGPDAVFRNILKFVEKAA